MRSARSGCATRRPSRPPRLQARVGRRPRPAGTCSTTCGRPGARSGVISSPSPSIELRCTPSPGSQTPEPMPSVERDHAGVAVGVDDRDVGGVADLLPAAVDAARGPAPPLGRRRGSRRGRRAARASVSIVLFRSCRARTRYAGQRSRARPASAAPGTAARSAGPIAPPPARTVSTSSCADPAGVEDGRPLVGQDPPAPGRGPGGTAGRRPRAACRRARRSTRPAPGSNAGATSDQRAGLRRGQHDPAAGQR